jgi:uridine kinase
VHEQPDPLLVAIVGGSGSGKSWLAERLSAALVPGVSRVSLDDFYIDRSHLPSARRALINFDHPRSIDWNLFLGVLRQLKIRQSALAPIYDFCTHRRGAQWRRVAAEPVIIAEGLWLLRRPTLRSMFHLRVFVDCPARTRLERRLARDAATRGRSPESIRHQFRETVQPMHSKYVAPQRQLADVVLRPGFGAQEIEDLLSRLRDMSNQ